jgi:hypothetical protein
LKRQPITDAMSWYFVECDDYVYQVINRTVPIGVQIEGNADWLLFNRVFLDYVVNSDDEFLVILRDYFKNFIVPTEVNYCYY